MNDAMLPPLVAAPDGVAELRLVLRLDWQDVAELGKLASDLAVRAQRPVSLDEAASHRLSSAAARPEAASAGRPEGSTPKHAPGALPAGATTEPSRQAIGTAAKPSTPQSLDSSATAAPRPAATATANQPSARATSSPIQPTSEEKALYPLAAAG